VCINKPEHWMRMKRYKLWLYRWDKKTNDPVHVVSRQVMVDWAKKLGNRAYVRDEDNPSIVAFCYVNHRGSTEFLQTYSDGRWTDNLLDLNECQ